MHLSFLPLLLLASVIPISAQERITQNPHTSPADVVAGGRIYRSHCVECHGRDGTGGRGPDLTRGDLLFGNSDKELADVISTGIPGTSMPLFFFNGKQLWQIVAFVQSLRKDEPTPQGSPFFGKILFHGKGTCIKCHMVNGQGGRQGPDLTVVGAKRSLLHLRYALTEPNQWVSPLDWKVQARTQDGKNIIGFRLNEDTHSIQIIDSKDNLVSLMKEDLQNYQINKTSSMPSYKTRLTQKELEDLIAYLYTLRGVKTKP